MNWIGFLSDFRNLKSQLIRKPYIMPKIWEMILNLEGFKYATSLDLNMGYYHMSIIKEASNLFTIILTWGNYKYKYLPMGVCNSPDIFQEKMNEMIPRIEFIRACIDDLLIITKGNWYDNLNKLELVLKNLRENGIKCNIKKSFSGQTEMEYLVLWVTRTGIKTVNKN